MLPEQLVEEVQALRDEDRAIDLVEEGDWAFVVFPRYLLPPGFNQSETALLLKVPLSYPNGNLDMFWTDLELRLASGEVPDRAEVEETILAKQWRRFSWHPQNWNPGVDNLRTYLEFVNSRLAKQR